MPAQLLRNALYSPAPGAPCDLPPPLLEPFAASGLVHCRKSWRVKRRPRKVLSHGRPTVLLASLTLSLSRVDRNRLRLPNTRYPARLLRTYTLLSSAYRTNRCPRRSNSR